MPALEWCCRKWRTGSDDFTWSGIILGLLSFVAAALSVSRIDADTSVIFDCPVATSTFQHSLHGLAAANFITAVLLGVLAAVSARGKIFEVRKRAAVPYVLYVVVASLLVQFVLSCIVASKAIYDGEVTLCSTFTTRSIVRASLAFSFLVPGGFLFLILISFDPSGRRKYDTEEDYHRLWLERCHVLCCCYRNSTSGQEAFSEAAKTLAVVFRGYDLVPSDIAAGMLLLQGFQTHQRERRVKQGGLRFLPDPLGRPEVLSTQARPAHVISREQRLTLDRVEYFSKYFLGAYGWMLYTFMNCATGLPRLWASDCTMCCRRQHHQGVEYHESCGCDTTAMRLMTKLSESDVLLTSFENSIYRPCFYVARDAATNSIVIAIRGTQSLVDCITDMVASPAELVLDPLTGAKGHVHSGMLLSATNILQILSDDRIMEGVLSGAWKQYNVMVLGHSLGAGTACVLTLLMHSRFPDLRNRLRCVAYSPPGGLMSENARVFSKSFIEGVLVGFDVVPRMSAHNFDHLRDSLLAALTHTVQPKAAVFCMCCCPKSLGEKLPEFRPDDVSSEQMRTLRRVIGDGVPMSAAPNQQSQNNPTMVDMAVGSPTSTSGGAHSSNHGSTAPAAVDASTSNSSSSTPVLLYPPQTMVHYVKMVRQGKSSCASCLMSQTHSGLLTRLVTEEVWCPVFIAPEELNYVLCHPMMTLDHFPDRVFDVIRGTHERLASGELDRFMNSGDSTEEQQQSPLMAAEFSLAYAPVGGAPSTGSARSSVYTAI